MKSILRSLIICSVLLFSLASCLLDRSPIGPAFPGSVTPNVVCPGETVEVTWDLSMLNADCVRDPRACERDPLTVEITAAGGMTFFVTGSNPVGAQSGIATGPDDATISIHAYDTNQDLGTRTETVNVLGPDEELTFNASCPGVCEAGVPTWAAMTVNFGRIMLSPSVRLLRVTNTNPIPIIITVYNEGELVGREINLEAGETTMPDFTTNIVKVEARPQPAFMSTFIIGSNCRGGSVEPMVPPRPINLSVTYGCPG